MDRWERSYELPDDKIDTLSWAVVAVNESASVVIVVAAVAVVVGGGGCAFAGFGVG